MKTLLLSLTCATVLAASAHAQVFQPKTARNVLIGGVVGAIIGENNDKPVQGAAIGAAAGLIWSAATQRHDGSPDCEPVQERNPVCRQQTRTVIVTQPRCEPPPRPVVIYRQPQQVRRPSCQQPTVVVVQPQRHGYRHHREQPRVIYVPADPYACDNAPVVVYESRQYQRW